MDISRKYLECGRLEDFIKLRAYFERREILSHWLKDNIWLISVLGEAVIRSLRPPVLSPDYTFPVLGNDPVACLVQRYVLFLNMSNLPIHQYLHIKMEKGKNLKYSAKILQSITFF